MPSGHCFGLLGDEYVPYKLYSDPYDGQQIKSYDYMLHRALVEVFLEPRRLSSDQIKKLLCAQEQDSIIKLILEKNPNLKVIFPKKMFSLLWFAVMGYYQNSAELLVRLGADVNKPCDSLLMSTFKVRLTVLHLLLRMYPSSWNERFIDLVVEHGADLQALDSKGHTVLHYAVRKSRVRVIELFLEKGVNVNATDNQGMTPLLTAALCSLKVNEIMQLLMKHGADVTVRDNNGYNVLHCLSRANVEHADMARVLIEKGASLDDATHDKLFQPLPEAAYLGKHELVKLFLDHGANVNARAIGGTTPLFCGSVSKDPEVLLTLLKRGANVDQKLTNGTTALHAACYSHIICEKGNEKNIEILLSVGMDMRVENDQGITPLWLGSAGSKTRVGRIPMLMLKTLALRKACLMQPWIELEDQKFFNLFPQLFSYYEAYVKTISTMKSMRLSHTCTLFDILTKCPCEIAELLYNRPFEEKLSKVDLDVFSDTYAADIRVASKRAKLHHCTTLKQEHTINAAVHNILPWEVVRKVACYAVDCEECELKKIVHASKKKYAHNA